MDAFQSSSLTHRQICDSHAKHAKPADAANPTAIASPAWRHRRFTSAAATLRPSASCCLRAIRCARYSAPQNAVVSARNLPPQCCRDAVAVAQQCRRHSLPRHRQRPQRLTSNHEQAARSTHRLAVPLRSWSCQPTTPTSRTPGGGRGKRPELPKALDSPAIDWARTSLYARSIVFCPANGARLGVSDGRPCSNRRPDTRIRPDVPTPGAGLAADGGGDGPLSQPSELAACE